MGCSNTIDLILEAGTDFEDSWIWKDSDKTPIPMPGWTAILEIKEATHLSIELTLNVDTGITLDPASGKISITISKVQIDALTFETGIYTLVLIDTLSNPEMFSRGTITVIRK